LTLFIGKIGKFSTLFDSLEFLNKGRGATLKSVIPLDLRGFGVLLSLCQLLPDQYRSA
jgi:hypothetical protein